MKTSDDGKDTDSRSEAQALQDYMDGKGELPEHYIPVTREQFHFIGRGPSKNLELEQRASRAWAVMWNTFDASVIEPFLDDDIVYGSQHIGDPKFKGKSRVLEHFQKKYSEMKGEVCADKVFAELCEYQNRPCVVLAEQTPENRVLTLVFEASGEGVTNVLLCAGCPFPDEVPPTGFYPETL